LHINPYIIYLSDGAPTVHYSCDPILDPPLCPFTSAQTDINNFKINYKNVYCPTCKSYAMSVQNNTYGNTIMTALADA
jgi:hypothetical protein